MLYRMLQIGFQFRHHRLVAETHYYLTLKALLQHVDIIGIVDNSAHSKYCNVNFAYRTTVPNLIVSSRTFELERAKTQPTQTRVIPCFALGGGGASEYF